MMYFLKKCYMIAEALTPLPQAIWENQYYYLFGFLFLVFIILVISVSQISVVMVYFQLCGEVRPVDLLNGFNYLNEKLND